MQNTIQAEVMPAHGPNGNFRISGDSTSIPKFGSRTMDSRLGEIRDHSFSKDKPLAGRHWPSYKKQNDPLART
jgi:hypothetical protein